MAPFLLLDETLSFGAYGNSGCGLFEENGIDAGRVDGIVGSLEHAVGGVGGFCAGKRGLVEHQRLAGSGYCFSASCPPSACSAAAAVIEELPSSSGISRRSDLKQSTKQLREAFEAAIAESNVKIDLVSSPDSYVQHIRWPEDAEDKFVHMAGDCASSRGLHVQICSPDLCCAETAFNARISAPKVAAATSLRACASARGPSSAEIASLGEMLGKCFSSMR